MNKDFEKLVKIYNNEGENKHKILERVCLKKIHKVFIWGNFHNFCILSRRSFVKTPLATLKGFLSPKDFMRRLMTLPRSLS